MTSTHCYFRRHVETPDILMHSTLPHLLSCLIFCGNPIFGLYVKHFDIDEADSWSRSGERLEHEQTTNLYALHTCVYRTMMSIPDTMKYAMTVRIILDGTVDTGRHKVTWHQYRSYFQLPQFRSGSLYNPCSLWTLRSVRHVGNRTNYMQIRGVGLFCKFEDNSALILPRS